MSSGLYLGIADHFGWAVAVTADADHQVVDRRRIELVEADVTPAPFHYESSKLDVAATAELVATVRASIERATTSALDALDANVAGRIVSLSLRSLPANFPTDIATLRASPWEARADAVMYREVLVAAAEAHGWSVHFYEAKSVLPEASALLDDRAADVFDGPRERLGPPWTKDHRVALAATVLATR